MVRIGPLLQALAVTCHLSLVWLTALNEMVQGIRWWTASHYKVLTCYNYHRHTLDIFLSLIKTITTKDKRIESHPLKKMPRNFSRTYYKYHDIFDHPYRCCCKCAIIKFSTWGTKETKKKNQTIFDRFTINDYQKSLSPREEEKTKKTKFYWL